MRYRNFSVAHPFHMRHKNMVGLTHDQAQSLVSLFLWRMDRRAPQNYTFLWRALLGAPQKQDI
jgi:hypothetical protein